MRTIKESIIISLSTAVESDFSNYDRSVGLCANVYYDLREKKQQIVPHRSGSFVGPIYGILRTAFIEWDKYSGMIGYPVPSTIQNLDPIEIYRYTRKHGDMYVGEYGELRKDLAVWTINFLKNH